MPAKCVYCIEKKTKKEEVMNGLVGRAVTLDTRDPQFKSSCMLFLLPVDGVEKARIKKHCLGVPP